jgi:hypothetical protein
MDNNVQLTDHAVCLFFGEGKTRNASNGGKVDRHGILGTGKFPTRSGQKKRRRSGAEDGETATARHQDVCASSLVVESKNTAARPHQ